MEKTYTCPICSKTFSDPKHKNRKYCSRECAWEAAREPEYRSRKCLACGKIYKPCRPSQKFCSLKCFGKTLEKSPLLYLCERCGKEFPRNKGVNRFCSYKCLFAHNSERAREKRASIICAHCGRIFSVRPSRVKQAKYCSLQCKSDAHHRELTCIVCGQTVKVRAHVVEDGKYTGKFCSYICAAQWQKGENHSNWQGGYEKWRGPNWHEQRAKARKRDNFTCQNCGVTEKELGRPLDVHHIMPWREFKNGWQEANRLSNLISFCPVCHTTIERS